jgi:hypothetical protein
MKITEFGKDSAVAQVSGVQPGKQSIRIFLEIEFAIGQVKVPGGFFVGRIPGMRCRKRSQRSRIVLFMKKTAAGGKGRFR